MKTISKTLLLGLATVGLCLTSCETLENRISEHPDVFNSLSPRDQALVRQGKIRSGMSTNAVWLAWGSPEQKTVGEMRGHPSETWIYVENRNARASGRADARRRSGRHQPAHYRMGRPRDEITRRRKGLALRPACR